MRTGFTLIEVVLALLVLEVGVLGVAGTLFLASSTLTRAETLERAVARAEGVLDSLRGRSAAGSGQTAFSAGEVRWVVSDSGGVAVRALGPNGDLLLEVRSVLAGR